MCIVYITHTDKCKTAAHSVTTVTEMYAEAQLKMGSGYEYSFDECSFDEC